ncbi:MAG: pyruvate dehydrogenase complex dihydrolipoamide acetyltransferase [Sphingobium sp.]
MAIEIKMPALSPTMEEGTLAKWLVKPGDTVSSGDLLAEIETDKATMEFEAVDEGTIARILVDEGTEGVKVGTVICVMAEEGEDASSLKDGGKAPAAAAPDAAAPASAAPAPAASAPAASAKPTPAPSASAPVAAAVQSSSGDRVKATPIARRIAAAKGIDLATVKGTGPAGRIVKADVEAMGASPAAAAAPAAASSSAPVAAPMAAQDFGIPHVAEKLSSMRKTIARRLTESKQQVPHIYLTVDIRLDALLKLRADLNESLAGRGIKLSVNDMLIKALAISLMQVPECNVQFAGDQLLKFSRADISVAVSIPSGLITPIIKEADTKSVAAISTEMKDLGARAKEGKLKPEEFQGGTASISNMGMMGIKQFEAVINPPQAMIMAIGAGERRPYVVDDALQIATVMSATGSFDHRAIDGADGARLMALFRQLVENPLSMLA